MVFGELEVFVDFKENKKALAALEALKPELEASRRFKAKAKRKGGTVIVNVKAEDAVSFRVAVNFYLRHLACLWNILNTINKTERLS